MAKEPVVIAGAGPVGITLAEILSQNGVPVTILEKSDAPNKEWRASTFHAGTLELLEETGVVEEMLKRGIEADKVQYRDRKEGLYAEFDFNLLKDETKYPFRLQLSQSAYVQIVYERLKERNNVDIRFQHEITDYVQDEENVYITMDTPEGKEQITTPFLLGTDGGRSVVRKKLGVQFEGYTHEERWLLVGTPNSFQDYIPDLAYVNYIADPKQFLFILHVPGAWRFLYPIPSHITDEEALDPDSIQQTMQSALDTKDNFPIVEKTIYKIHQRVADKFYKGRVAVVGDAAHLNSPMGGLGLNSGIHDAVDISKRMIRIYEGRTNHEAEFEKYSELRRRVATDYVKEISEKNTKTLKAKDPEERIQLQKDMADQANDPERAKKWMLRSAMLASVREQGIGEPPTSVST